MQKERHFVGHISIWLLRCYLNHSTIITLIYGRWEFFSMKCFMAMLPLKERLQLKSKKPCSKEVTN